MITWTGKQLLNQILANAGEETTFTARLPKTGQNFTYLVVKPRPDTPILIKARVNGRYQLLGAIYHHSFYAPANESRISNTPHAHLFGWLWDQLQTGRLPASVEITAGSRLGRWPAPRPAVGRQLEMAFAQTHSARAHSPAQVLHRPPA